MNRYAAAIAAGRFPSHVRVLPSFRPFGPRHDAHWGEASSDCSHFCYAPFLWDSALAPFYEDVLRWWVARDGEAAGGERVSAPLASRPAL